MAAHCSGPRRVYSALDSAPQNNELQRTRDGNAAASPLNSVFCGHLTADERKTNGCGGVDAVSRADRSGLGGLAVWCRVHDQVGVACEGPAESAVDAAVESV